MTILGEPSAGVVHHQEQQQQLLSLYQQLRSSASDNGTHAELLTAAGEGSDVDNGNIQDLLNDTDSELSSLSHLETIVFGRVEVATLGNVACALCVCTIDATSGSIALSNSAGLLMKYLQSSNGTKRPDE
uniref:Uncharacterized protein n=1 Tax=Anopheles culicifacies TaxID=139723 RepID=A0A182MLK9_9DIPT